jgi:hypothetical protein
MADRILVLIKSDPLKNHRPVEAVRIALGLASGEHAVTIILLNQAALLLDDTVEDLVDGDILNKYLPSFKEMEQTFHVDENFIRLHPLRDSDYLIEAVSLQKVADLVRDSGRFFIF